MKYLLGTDIGTSGTKTVLFDECGRTVAEAVKEYPLYQPKNGWAEQDPDDWWSAVISTVSRVVSESGVNPSDIAGVGMSGQMHGLVMLDRNGTVLRRSIIWCDQRTEKECRELERAVGKERLVKITANPAMTGFTASKILWVRNNEPEIYKRCVHFLLPKDYIRYKLTGEFATDVSDAGGMQLLDVAKRAWSLDVINALDIDKDFFAKVYESPEITGCVTDEAARLTGLRAGTPVVGGAGDNAAAAVGMGVVRDGMGFTTIGTSGVVFAHTSEMHSDPAGRIHTLCAAVPGEWHVMGVTQAAGLSLKWFKDQFYASEAEASKKSGRSIYAELDKIAEKVPAGANGLYYLPYLMGERTPHLDARARGAFVGLSAVHTRADMLRSVMEGVTHSLRDCLDIFVDAGVKVDTMLACGGGASSGLWRQMLADMFECDVVSTETSGGAALGAAILAGVGAGVYKSVADGCDTVAAECTVTHPDSANTAVYRKAHVKYDSLYPNLRNFYNLL